MKEIAGNIALLYHANLNHVSLSPEGRDGMSAQYISDLLGAIEIPATVSMPAEDLLYLKAYYPETYKDIIHHPSLTLLLSSYAHVVAGLDFNQYGTHATLGTKLYKELVPKPLLSSIAYPSEVELPPENVLPELHSIWDGIILGETRVQLNTIATTPIPDHVRLQLPDSNLTLPASISRRETNYRPVFHEYLRGEREAQAVYEALIHDTNLWSSAHGHIARIDLEAPVLNEIQYPDGTCSGPQIEKWQKLQKCFLQHSGDFISVDEVFTREAERPMVQVSHDAAEDAKWAHHEDISLIRELGAYVRTLHDCYLMLSTHHSDYFCTQSSDWTFPMASGGRIVIAKNQRYRKPELDAKIALLKGNALNQDEKSMWYATRIQSLGPFIDQILDSSKKC